MLKHMMVVAVLLVGCDGGDEDGRGGGGGGVDAPPRATDAPGACTTNPDSCTGTKICVVGNTACVEAFPRSYSIVDLRLTMPGTDPQGAAWDAGGGPPDLFAKILIGPTVVATTPVVANQLAATFAGPYEVQLTAGSTLTIDAYDEDLTVNDLAVRCAAAPITAAQLRSHALSCAATATSGSVSYVIIPTP